MTEITIKAKQEPKLKSHEGFFTKSYLIAQAIYDFETRDWIISSNQNTFTVTNETESAEVYYDKSIANCSCEWFVENECGTCPHIEAVKSSQLHGEKTRPIIFLNDNFELTQREKGENTYKTPAIPTFLNLRKKKKVEADDFKIESFDILEGINLFEFQKESVQQMLNVKRSVLALKTGIGKTLCSLACVKLLAKDKVIVISPNNLKYQWQEQINRFSLGDSIIIDKGSDLEKYKDQKFLIVSYELLNRNISFLVDNKFDIAIIDEIQKVKNSESVTWKTISLVQSEYLFALSATPIENAASDLISVLNIINPYIIQPEWKFYQRYFNTSRARILGIKGENKNELLDKISKFIIKPKIDYKSIVLPKKLERVITSKLSPAQQEIHDSYLLMARPLIAKSFNHKLSFGEMARLNSVLLKARMAALDGRLVGLDEKSERLQLIEDTISELVSEGKSVIVFSEWIKSSSLLKEFMDNEKITYSIFNGELSNKQKEKSKADFISGKTRVLLSTDSGGIGVDGLQHACHNIIHMEPVWNPKKIEQRNGRLVRTLQKAKFVDIYYFRAEAEIEQNLIAKAVERKNNLFDELLNK